MEEALVCADRPEPEILPGFRGGGGKCLPHQRSTHCSAPRGAPGAPKLTPGRLSSQMPRSWSIALEGFVLLEDLLHAHPVSPPRSRIARHYGLFYLFPLQAADLDGEIDLSTCYDVTEYPVQRNYGFQIHVSKTWGGGRVRLPDGQRGCSCCAAAWGCSSVARETPKRGHSASSAKLWKRVTLGLRGSFLVHKKSRGRGRFCRSQLWQHQSDG